MSVSVLIPYGRPMGTSGEWRLRTFAWIEARWHALYPDYEVIVAAPDEVGDPGRFNRPLAINRAAEQASGDVLIVADADTAFDDGWPERAVRAVLDGVWWALPRHYRKLTQRSTTALLRADPAGALAGDIDEETDYSWSGLVVVPRDAFYRVGGFDERFAGWGHDDIAFGVCMETLVGPHTRVDGQALHLWHPTPLEHNYGHSGNDAQRELAERYVAAADDEQAMRDVRWGR